MDSMLEIPFRLLTLLVFLPTAGAIFMLFMRKESESTLKGFAIATSLVTFVASLPLYFMYQPDKALWLIEPVLSWIPAWGISYRVGIDGISLFLLLLTTFITPICLLASWNYIGKRIKDGAIGKLIVLRAYWNTANPAKTTASIR